MNAEGNGHIGPHKSVTQPTDRSNKTGENTLKAVSKEYKRVNPTDRSNKTGENTPPLNGDSAPVSPIASPMETDDGGQIPTDDSVTPPLIHPSIETEEGAPSPFDSVFTTLPWNGGVMVDSPLMHLERMHSHAERLRIAWPSNFVEALRNAVSEAIYQPLSHQSPPHTSGSPIGLMTIRLFSTGIITVTTRSNPNHTHSPFCAVTCPAPRWSRRVTGTKHGDWNPYLAATSLARKGGCDISLLVWDNAVIDADRATPVLLDEDGTAWTSSIDSGCVDSITLKLVSPALFRAGVPLQRGRLHAGLLGRAKEIIVVGSGIGVTPIDEIDDQVVGDNSLVMTNLIREELMRRREGSWENLLEFASGFNRGE